MEPSLNETMAAYAEATVDGATKQYGVTLDYTPESLDDLESIAARLHDAHAEGGLTDETVDMLCRMLGGYVGEVIRRHKGGEWSTDNQFQSIGLKFDTLNWAFPVSKVYKRIVDGPDDNIASFAGVAIYNFDDIKPPRVTRPRINRSAHRPDWASLPYRRAPSNACSS